MSDHNKRVLDFGFRQGVRIMESVISQALLVAAEELGRQWIGVDIGDEAIATIIDRFKHGSKPMGDYVKKKPKKQLAMALFDDEDFEEEDAESITLDNISYDLFEET